MTMTVTTLITRLVSLVSPAVLGQYVPFVVPLRIDAYWLLLLLPLVVAIAITYKTIKLDDLSRLSREATLLSLQIVIFMVLAAVTLWLLTELI